MEENDILTESPEEKAFFDNKGAETVVEKPEPELPLEQKQEEPKPVEVKESQKPTHVPLAALLEEREKHSTRYNKLESRLEKLQQLIDGPPPEPEQINPELDPIKAIQSLHQKIERLETEKQQVGEFQALTQFGQRQAQAFAQEKPDFFDAYNHLRHSRANQLWESGQVQTAKELNERVLQEEQNIIKMCAGMGIDPARFMYHLAGAAGYAVKAPEPVKEIPEPSKEEQIKTAAQAQARASQPIKANGGGGGPPDLKALVQLSDEEFDKATSGDNWRKLAGGKR